MTEIDNNSANQNETLEVENTKCNPLLEVKTSQPIMNLRLFGLDKIKKTESESENSE